MKKIFYIIFLITGISVQVRGQWTRTSNGLPLTNTTSVSDIYSVNSNLIAGLFGNSKGYYYSDDSGITWKLATASTKQVFHFTYNNATLFAGTDNGIFKSTDDGKTWIDADPNTDLPKNSVIYGLGTEGINLTAASYGSEINQTTDEGNSWSKINKKPPDKNVHAILVSNNRVFAGTESGLYYFDGTNNWLSPTFVPTASNNKFFNAVVKIGTTLFAGTASNSSYKSSDNGLTWTEISTLTNATSFVGIGNNIFASTAGGGVYLSANNGTTWKTLNTNLTALSVNGLAIKGNTLFAATSLGGIWSRPLPQLTSPGSGLSYSFSTSVGIPSPSQTLRVTGIGLAGNVTVAVPAPFEVSLTSTSGFSQSLTLTPSNDGVDVTVYIRLNPASLGNSNANLTLSSLGVADQTVAVNGSTCSPLAFQSAVLPAALYNSPYNKSLTTTGGTAPYTYTLTSGLLPSGITLTQTGILSGTTSQLGTFNFGLTVVDANNCTITASSSLTVNKASQSITFGSLTGRNCGETFTLNASSSSGLTLTYLSSDISVATVSGNVVTPVGAGTTTITASQAGNGNYNPATDATQSLTVSKSNQALVFNTLLAKTYGDIPFSLSAVSNSALPVSYTSSNTSVATVTGNLVIIMGVGSTIISASQSGNTCYNPATGVVQTLTVNKGNQSITFGSLAGRSCGETFALNATSSAGLPVSYISSNSSVATVSGNVVTCLGTGTTSITASQAGNTNYNLATDVAQTLTVSKIGQTLTFGSLTSRQVSDPPFGLSATSTSGLPVSYSSSNTSIATVSGNTLTITGAGAVNITASQSGNTCYNATPDVSQTLIINKSGQSITFASLSNRSCGETFNLSASSSSGLGITYSSSNPLVATVSGNVVTCQGTGTATIAASQGGNSSYNPATDVSQTLTVSKVGQTITFSPLTAKTFGVTPFSLSATSTSLLPVTYSSSNTTIATVSGNTVTIVGVGAVGIIASQSGNGCYNPATDVVQTLSVNKASQSITFGSLTGRNCGETFTLNASSSSGLTLTYLSSDISVATVSGNVVTPVGAGTTTITASQAGNGNYNPATDATQSLTVSKSNQALVFNTLPAKTYGDSPFTLSAVSSSALPVSYTSSNPAIATISGNTVTITGAGSVNITASQSGNSCYNAAAEVVQILTINKANQSITFGNLASRNCGESFTLNATSSAGLPVSYSSSNPSVATLSGRKVTLISTGNAIIKASQLGDGNNNEAASVEQFLVVNKANQGITFESLPEKFFGQAAFTLNATASSGLPISYSSSNTNVATVSGNTVTILTEGTTLITASQSGNNCFTDATEIQQILTIKADKTPPVISDISAPPVETNIPIPVSVKITDDIGVSGVILKYNGIARPAFINGIVALNKASNDTYIGTIPGNADETGISFVIEAKDLSHNLKTASGQVAVTYPAGVKVAYTRPGGGINNYRLISIPLELDNKDVTEVFNELNGYDPKRWRVYTYANGNLIEYGKGFNNFIQGRGYWFVSKNSINRPTGKGNSFANAVQTPLYTILSQGFTLIGNPYNYNISWDDVLNYPKNKKWKDAGLKLITWTADPSNDKIPRWSKIDSISSPGNRRLLRNEGGYVGLTLPLTDTLFFPAAINPAVQKTGSPFITKRVMQEKDWQINFSLSNAHQAYNLSALGMKADALTGGDKYDALTVPRFLDYLEFNAYHKNFFYLPFSEDIVPVAENYFWEFIAESNAENQVTELKWTVPDFADKEFVLFDMKTQKRINMKKEKGYSFNLESSHPFRIYYGSKEYVEKNVEPVSFELMQNHPNPFTEKTTIEFTLPESQDLYSVEMSLYDELGRESSTLLKGEYKGGFYEYEWEGKDSKGIKLRGGIYFCKLKSTNRTGSQQKIIRILVQ